jgi:hypothetical protein
MAEIPIDNSDITEETALQILIQELEDQGIWQKSLRVKIAVKILSGNIQRLEGKIEEAVSILTAA